ncbi:hypothetical protein [Rubellicoccus peritrichatus]|uniref:Peptidase S1 domain-containing protein n=1 Tax=Rubellicoccus peritrichatus TaxID=3080537 RepID=A0AAQ3QT03_9BACT|nr:hypothetical protein [Puniceicoccus sp. CR14]WOO43163.1 hypothetical protein RZN69_08660 [Puniceicoccus sp. CR14]
MKIIGYSGSAPKARLKLRSDIPGLMTDYESEPKYTAPNLQRTEQQDDAIFEIHAPASYYNDGRILVSGVLSASIESLTPEVAIADELGNVTRITPGRAKFAIRTKRARILLTLDLTDKTDMPEVKEYISPTSGSLLAHMADQVDSRINSGMSIAENGYLYTSQDPSGSYTRNPNFWASGLDLTCISPWNSNGGVRKAGTLITPRHVLLAAHYEVPVGTNFVFVNMAGNVVKRTAIGKQRHPQYSVFGADITVYTLNSDVPSSITPCKVLPQDYYEQIVNEKFVRPGALGLDQEEKGLIIDWFRDGYFEYPTDSDRAIFDEKKISGDSGNPAFVLINDELVLITVWTFGGAGSGTFVTDELATLNQMIMDSDADAGITPTGYTMQEIDLSSFPSYTPDPDVESFVSSTGATNTNGLTNLSRYLKQENLWDSFGIYPYASNQNFPSGSFMFGLGGLVSGFSGLVGSPPRDTYGVDLTANGFVTVPIPDFQNWTEGAIGVRFKPADAAATDVHNKHRWWFGDTVQNRYLVTSSGSSVLSGEQFMARYNDGATHSAGSTTATWAADEDMQEVSVFGSAHAIYKNKTPYVFDLSPGDAFNPAATGYTVNDTLYLSAQYSNPSATAQNTGVFNCIWFCSVALTDNQREVITDLVNLL